MTDPYRALEEVTRCFYCSAKITGQDRVSFFDHDAGVRAFVCPRSACTIQLDQRCGDAEVTKEADV